MAPSGLNYFKEKVIGLFFNSIPGQWLDLWPPKAHHCCVMFDSRVIHPIKFCTINYCSWEKCSFKIFHVLRNVILSSWPGLSCTKEQISHSPSVFSFMNIVDKLSVVLIVDSEWAERAPNTNNEVKERPREKKKKTGERENWVCVTLSGSPFNKSNKLGFFWVTHWIQMTVSSLHPAQYSID